MPDLRYSRFHTTALCSPTRAALLSGRNHHSVGMGGITEIATSAPGYSSLRPNSCAPLAQTLTLNGYSTAQFGKCHEVPVWQTSPMGPFDNWPSGGGGFEHFYGFLGGETNQYAPALYDGMVPVEPDRTPEEGYHLNEDLSDRAIGWVRQQKALMPDKPFFVYFAPGATHAPHHVPAGMVGEIQRRLRPGVGRAARGDVRASEAAGRDRRRCRSDRAARADSRVGGHAGCPQARARPSDGGLRGLSRAHRPPRGAADRCPRRHGGAGRHARVRDHRRQRRIRRGHAQGQLQRAPDAEWRRRSRDRRIHERANRPLRHAAGVQPLRRRLGTRDEHAVPVDEAGRLALGRYAQRHDRALAERHQGQGRDPSPVPPRHRRRADRARSRRAARAVVRERHPATALRGRLDALLVRRRGRARPAHAAVLRDVRQSRHLSRRLDGRHPALHSLGRARPYPGDRRRRLGALRTR